MFCVGLFFLIVPTFINCCHFPNRIIVLLAETRFQCGVIIQTKHSIVFSQVQRIIFAEKRNNSLKTKIYFCSARIRVHSSIEIAHLLILREDQRDGRAFPLEQIVLLISFFGYSRESEVEESNLLSDQSTSRLSRVQYRRLISAHFS